MQLSKTYDSERSAIELSLSAPSPICHIHELLNIHSPLQYLLHVMNNVMNGVAHTLYSTTDSQIATTSMDYTQELPQELPL